MRRADVIAIVLAVAAAALGASAGTGPLFGGLAALVLIGRAVRARTAHFIVIWAVTPLLVWATFPDPSAIAAAIALTGCAACALLGARDRRTPESDGVIAARVTLAAAMIVTASGLLTFDILLR
jgi:hypothetical protein